MGNTFLLFSRTAVRLTPFFCIASLLLIHDCHPREVAWQIPVFSFTTSFLTCLLIEQRIRLIPNDVTPDAKKLKSERAMLSPLLCSVGGTIRMAKLNNKSLVLIVNMYGIEFNCVFRGLPLDQL